MICEVPLEAEGITRIEATVNLTGRRVEQLVPNGTLVGDYEELDLPEEYTPIPGY